MEGQLTKKRYVTLRQFHLQPLLITTLVQSRSQFTVYLMKSADNIIQTLKRKTQAKNPQASEKYKQKDAGELFHVAGV